MSEQLLRIRGLDTLLFRDGRPFSNEPGAFIARTLRAPLPGTVAGFLRTRIGKRKGWNWDDNGPGDALKITVDGPILLFNGQPVFHAPADALIYKDENDQDKEKVMYLRPKTDADGGTNIPDGMLPMEVTEDVKPEPDYNFWKWEDIKRWLLHSSGDNFQPPEKIQGLPLEERVHVEISDAGTSEEGKLFSAQFLGFEQHRWEGFTGKPKEKWSIVAKVESDLDNLNGVGQLGGENRPAVVEKASEQDWPVCPVDLKNALSTSTYVRMILATPAIFTHGWKPGWLDGQLTGSPPGANNCKLKLVAAAVKRREPVSGWDYKWKQPKPVRWMVPAGSVYFFEVQDKTDFPVEQVWMKTVSDDPQDQKDGYGLALWGIWKGHNQGDKS
jgi:CRISPR-associated protein Cmr3